MMVTAWRIVATRLASGAFSGEGARRDGGRWNSPGVRMVYTAGTISLALLEILVHLNTGDPIPLYSRCSVRFDDSLVIALDLKQLPRNWRQSPTPAAARAVGDQWIASARSAVLKVPSAVVEEESNYLINPAHADFKLIEIGQFQPIRLDPRLL
jgi:RES domain-containing protein